MEWEALGARLVFDAVAGEHDHPALRQRPVADLVFFAVEGVAQRAHNIGASLSGLVEQQDAVFLAGRLDAYQYRGLRLDSGD